MQEGLSGCECCERYGQDNLLKMFAPSAGITSTLSAQGRALQRADRHGPLRAPVQGQSCGHHAMRPDSPHKEPAYREIVQVALSRSWRTPKSLGRDSLLRATEAALANCLCASANFVQRLICSLAFAKYRAPPLRLGI